MDNIKVAIRVRGLISREVNAGAKIKWIIRGNTIYQDDAECKQDSCFVFDSISDSHRSNLEVFTEVAQPIVAGVMKGINGSVFAYGQTSSGKTYTMLGDAHQPGVIPLAIKDIFDTIENTPDREFLLRVSYMEIYNEEIQDLLTGAKNLKIRETIEKEVYVADLKEELVTDAQQIYALMRQGEQRRHTGATNMNERSSRSHTIFRVIVESRQRMSNEEEADLAVNVSHMNLVDLAGSERTNQTGATGDRLKEGCAINKSLFTLGYVICKLSEGDNFVPYRDSKLTRILQNSLGGNSRTAIVCTVTPVAIEETASTLKFASRAKNIRNRPTVNEVLSDEALLRRYRKQIQQLQQQLEQGCPVSLDSNHPDVAALERQLAEKSQKESELRMLVDKLTQMICVSHTNSTGGQTAEAVAVQKKDRRRETWCPGKQQTFRWSKVGSLPKITRPMGEDFSIMQSPEEVFNAAERCRIAEMELDDMFALPTSQTRRLVSSAEFNGSAMPHTSNDTSAMHLEVTPHANTANVSAQVDIDDAGIKDLEQMVAMLQEENVMLKAQLDELECDLKSQSEKEVANLQQALQAAEWQRDELQKELSSLRREMDEQKNLAAERDVTALPAALVADPHLSDEVALLRLQMTETSRVLGAMIEEKALLTEEVAMLQRRLDDRHNSSLWAFEALESIAGNLEQHEAELSELRHKAQATNEKQSTTTDLGIQTSPMSHQSSASLDDSVKDYFALPRAECSEAKKPVRSPASTSHENKILRDGLRTAQARIDVLLRQAADLGIELNKKQDASESEHAARIVVLEAECGRLRSEVEIISRDRDALAAQLVNQGDTSVAVCTHAVLPKCLNSKDVTLDSSLLEVTSYVDVMRQQPSEKVQGMLPSLYDELQLADSGSFLSAQATNLSHHSNSLSQALQDDNYSVISSDLDVTKSPLIDLEQERDLLKATCSTLEKQLNSANAKLNAVAAIQGSPSSACAPLATNKATPSALSCAVAIVCPNTQSLDFTSMVHGGTADQTPSRAPTSDRKSGQSPTPNFDGSCSTSLSPGAKGGEASLADEIKASQANCVLAALDINEDDRLREQNSEVQHSTSIVRLLSDSQSLDAETLPQITHDVDDRQSQAMFGLGTRVPTKPQEEGVDLLQLSECATPDVLEQKYDMKKRLDAAEAEVAELRAYVMQLELSEGELKEQLSSIPQELQLGIKKEHGCDFVEQADGDAADNEVNIANEKLAAAQDEIAQLRQSLDEQLRIETYYMETVTCLRKELDSALATMTLCEKDNSSKRDLADQTLSTVQAMQPTAAAFPEGHADQQASTTITEGRLDHPASRTLTEGHAVLPVSAALRGDLTDLTLNPASPDNQADQPRSSTILEDHQADRLTRTAFHQPDVPMIAAFPDSQADWSADSAVLEDQVDQPMDTAKAGPHENGCCTPRQGNLQSADETTGTSSASRLNEDSNDHLSRQLRDSSMCLDDALQKLQESEHESVELRSTLKQSADTVEQYKDEISLLKEQLQEALKNLAVAEGESDRLKAVIKDCTLEIQQLKSSMCAATQTYRRTEEQEATITALEATVRDMRTSLTNETENKVYLEKKVCDTANRLDQVLVDLSSARDENARLQSALDKGLSNVEKLQSELLVARSQSDAELRSTVTKLASTVAESQQLRLDLSAQSAEAEKLKAELLSTSLLLTESCATVESLRSTLKEENLNRQSVEEQTAGLTKQLDEAITKLLASQDENIRLTAAVDMHVAQIGQLKAELGMFAARPCERRDDSADKLLQTMAEYNQLSAKLESQIAENEQLKSELASVDLQLTESHATAESMAAELCGQLKIEKERAEQLSNQIRMLTDQLTSQKQKLDLAEAEAADLRAITAEQQKEDTELRAKITSLEDCVAQEQADRLREKNLMTEVIKARELDFAKVQTKYEQDLGMATHEHGSSCVARSRYDVVVKHAGELNKTKGSLEEKIKQLEVQLNTPNDHWKTIVDKKEEDIQWLQGQVQRIMRCCEDADNELDEEKRLHDELKTVVDKLQKQLEALQAQCENQQSSFKSETFELQLKIEHLEREILAQTKPLKQRIANLSKEALSLQERCTFYKNEARRVQEDQHNVTVAVKKFVSVAAQCDSSMDPTYSHPSSATAAAGSLWNPSIPLQPPGCGVIEQLEKDQLKGEVAHLRRQVKQLHVQLVALQQADTCHVPTAALHKAKSSGAVAASHQSTAQQQAVTSKQPELPPMQSQQKINSGPQQYTAESRSFKADRYTEVQSRTPLSGITNSPKKGAPTKAKFFPAVGQADSPQAAGRRPVPSNQPLPADDDDITGCKQQ